MAAKDTDERKQDDQDGHRCRRQPAIGQAGLGKGPLQGEIGGDPENGQQHQSQQDHLAEQPDDFRIAELCDGEHDQ